MKLIYKFIFFILVFSKHFLYAQSEKQTHSMEEWLKENSYIDFSNPIVKSKISELTKYKRTDTEKALSIFLYVRDEIQFGWSRKFYDSKASEVIEDKIGYCNTKSTLFVALLRGAGIPARQHFVEITGKVLFGFSIPSQTVDHSYTEIFLKDKWVSVDSYVIDKKLYQKSIVKLKEEGLEQGYGIHRDGTVDWDGKSNSFIQYVPSQTQNSIDWGNYSDIAKFYHEAKGTHNKMNILLKLIIPIFLSTPNAEVSNLRK